MARLCCSGTMVTLSALTIIIAGLVLHESSCQRDDLCYSYKHPLSVNASMGSIAEFNCSCDSGQAIVWFMNGELISQRHRAENGTTFQTTTRNGSFVSTLSVLATEGNDNSRIECGVFEFGLGIRRPATPGTAILRVQGLLAAPGDLGLRMIAQENIIHVKWTPPFSLDGVGISGYFLAFTDITEVNASTTETIRLSDTETEKNLTTESLLPCHRYQFLVWAYNDAGNGSLSERMNASFQNAPGAVEGVKATIKLGSDIDVGVTLMFQEEDCPGQETDNYIVHILTAPTQSYLCTHTKLRTMSSMEEVVLNFTTDFLEHNQHYLALVEAQNHIGGRNSSEIHFSTFDVQNIEPLEDPPGNFCVHCIFANGSNAKGCHIKVEETMSESRAYRNTSSPTCFEVAKGGNYTLIVYDIEATSEISTQAAIKTTIITMGQGPSSSMTIHQSHTRLVLAVGVAVLTILLMPGMELG